MRYLLRLFIVITLSLSLFACASSGNPSISEGQAAFQKQDYHNAFDRLYPAAVNGDARAQYAIGYMLYYGKTGIVDRNAGMMWIQKAAEQGDKQAQQAWQLISQQMVLDTNSNNQDFVKQ